MTDADGNFIIDMVDGVEKFTNAELAVIPDTGHEMFVENPGTSTPVVREYLDAPAR